MSGLSLFICAVLVAAAIFFAIWLRKRYSLQATGTMHEAVAKGSWNLAIHVSNTGRRPILLCFVTIKQPGHTVLKIPFGGSDAVPLDVDDSLVREIKGNSGEGFWKTDNDVRKSRICIEDARGKSHRVRV